jgi:SsrA-binding protein
MKEYAVHRRARFDFEILATYEAGIELYGHEVKAIKAGHISLAGSFAVIRDNQMWLLNTTVSPYQVKNTPADYEPTRTRRLLLKKSEIKELIGKSAQKGLTLIPLKVYTTRSKIKVLLGLGKHKKKQDKRETIKKRDTEREIERALKQG